MDKLYSTYILLIIWLFIFCSFSTFQHHINHNTLILLIGRKTASSLYELLLDNQLQSWNNNMLVRAECMRMNVVRALADVVATKLCIILLSFSFRLLFSQKEFAYDFEFLYAFLSNKRNKI